jgi:hypothetical protein
VFDFVGFSLYIFASFPWIVVKRNLCNRLSNALISSLGFR